MAGSFEIGTVRCEPGTLATGYIESVYLRDASRVKIPLIVLHGIQPGPILWAGSTVHGNEIPGCEVIRRLTREVLDPKRLRGTLVASPVQHPVAYLDSSRLTSQDGADINRILPGDPKGGFTQRIGYDLFHQGVSKADVVLDIHSNAPGAVCFNIVRTGGSGPQWDAQWSLAEAFGITIAVSPVGEAGLKGGTLHDAVLVTGKPALTIELSGAHFWEEPSVRAGVTGVLNVMKHLTMIDGAIEPQTEVHVIPGRLANRHFLICERGGFTRPRVPIGSKVSKGESVVTLYDLFGNELETLHSPIDGWVITYRTWGNRTAVSGDTVAFVFGH